MSLCFVAVNTSLHPAMYMYNKFYSKQCKEGARSSYHDGQDMIILLVPSRRPPCTEEEGGEE